VFGLLDDDVEPDAEVRGYDVHQSETSHNDVAVLDDLNLSQKGRVINSSAFI
jgi:hypothetical protein